MSGSATALRQQGSHLRPFTFGQLDGCLAEQRTEEAFAGASERLVKNVVFWHMA